MPNNTTTKVYPRTFEGSIESCSHRHEDICVKNPTYLEIDDLQQKGSAEMVVGKDLKEVSEDSATSEQLRYYRSCLPREHRISDFPDTEYGEPMRFQHIIIDFGPTDDLDDNEYLWKKCRDFWKVIEMNSAIQHLQVFPTKLDVTETPSTATTSTTEINMPSTDGVGWLENDTIVSCALATKLQQPYCDEEKGDYRIGLQNTDNITNVRKSEMCPVNTCIFGDTLSTDKAGSSDIKLTRRSSSRMYSTKADVIQLCKEMEEWEIDHPKSLDPPGHPPLLPHAIMQKHY